ncbi:toll/interleukin-1 receptor domain-containing protein [Hydrogenophaga sp.]|uniref:toll/interleukin-1 receptor domain-containing protein n=2 Tax=Hydrogenophaga sp. TaxID=1904254 RepID=UPI00272709C8|nr:toll/interleukin-1 receptor domain-containing protein [Hydrogenophaga sp.]MDO8888598.1 toll/interleukin-1 receptor domain-containing protein [Hydrogenophaga sp.]MDP1781517.1 toll/interleukin-1 receptor domain-containing protein [Hydrogenophaga sp.]MDP3351008.1 toll/interleukin-1 receptor domain-containing protein [Hydrogenophaga sp.]MDZ4400567.1 toll/interleukin-1 receptor domain-containing protein [Hydrogenophaga sp.]
MNRIFISYRSSDGKKDADRLCADLSRLYGADQVFFDKQDLRGGHSWRSAIMAALGTQPVVLLLVTPELLGMAHPEGGRRIDRDDDPIRGEVLTAQANGATIVPLLTEGMVMPATADIPPPLRFLKESHALKLRTEDWADDLDKIVADLATHGIHPLVSRDPVRPEKRSWVQRMQRGFMWIGGIFVGLVVIGLLAPDDEEEVPPSPPPYVAATPEPVPRSGQSALDVSGIWWSIDEDNRRLRVQFTVNNGAIQLQTDAFPVSWYPEWQAYAQGVRGQGLTVNEVRYVGQGVLTDVMGVPRIEIPYQAVTGDGRGPLDTGSVVLNASADGRELTGQLWSNGEQAESPLRLVRSP